MIRGQSIQQKTQLCHEILEFSFRISFAARPMKPFLRFAEQAQALYGEAVPRWRKQQFWDFDHSLQQVLLCLLHSLASPEDIAQCCVERWKINLARLGAERRGALDSLPAAAVAASSVENPRESFIRAQIPGDKPLLYIGCGTGTECFHLCDRGYRLVGIDTALVLLQIARDWGAQSRRAFSAVCMDVDHLGWNPGAFGGFLLEFYGYQLALEQILNLQRSLASLLDRNGRGVIVANRKTYPAYLQSPNSSYPSAMLAWLDGQAELDFAYAERDACEENLSFGLVWRSHTRESLALELSYAFEVLHCEVEDSDPRYLISVVSPRETAAAEVLDHPHFKRYPVLARPPVSGEMAIRACLHEIATICSLLEAHVARVEQYFRAEGAGENKSQPVGHPLTVLEVDLTDLTVRLAQVFELTK